MNIEEKRNIILQRISQLDERIQILQSNIDGGYQNKEGSPSFESLIQDSIRAKNAFIAAIDDLQLNGIIMKGGKNDIVNKCR